MAEQLGVVAEFEELREEIERLRRELAVARRMAQRSDEAGAAAAQREEGERATSAVRTAAAEMDAQAAWERAAELGTALGRRIAEGQARLIAAQSAATALEHANAGLSAGQARLALREADLKAVIESAIDCAIVTTDRRGLVLAWNPGARRLLGWEEEAALRMSVLMALAPEGQPGGLRGSDIATAVAGERLSREGWLRRQDGSLLWAGIEAMALRADDAAEPLGVLWMLRDRSRERAAAEALRESEERHRLLVGSMAQAVWETDAEGRVVSDSPSWRAYTGQSLEQLLAQRWLEAVHPDDRAAAEQVFLAAIAERRILDAEFRIWHAASGDWRWTNIRAAPVTGADGAVVKWVGMNIDISARKAAESALRAQEAKYRSLFETIDEGYCIIQLLRDAEGRVEDWRFLEVNPAFARHSGLSDAAGRRVRELIPDLDAHWFRTYGRVVLTGEPARFVNYAEPLGRWFDVLAFRVGEAGEDRLAVLFNDITAQKRAEAAVRESEARLQVAIEAADLGTWDLDLTTDTSSVRSLRHDQMFGYDTPQAEWGQAIAERHVVEADRPAFREAFARALTTGVLDFEVRVRWPDGSIHWIAPRGRTSYDENGRPVRMSGVVADITERKQAEARLRIVHEETQRVYDDAPVGLCVLDRALRWVRINRVLAEINGFPPEAHIGRSVRELLPSVAEAAEPMLRRILDTGEPALGVEVVGETPARPGEQRTWIEDWLPIRDADGQVCGINVVAREVTELRAAEAALRISEERFRGFAENSTAVLWIAEAAGSRLDYLSPAFETMFGAPRNAVMDDVEQVRAMVHPDDRAAFDAALPRVQRGETVTVEYRVIRPADRGVVTLLDTAFPVRGPDGAIRQVAGIVQDVTEQRRMEADLAKRERHLRALVEGVPHLLWRAAAHGHWHWASPQWTAFTGLSEAASLGRGWLAAVHPEDRDRVAAAWGAVGEGATFAADFRLRCVADGSWRWFRSRGIPLHGGDAGQADAPDWLGTSTDVDDQIRAQEALQRGRDELEARVAQRTAELMAAEETLRQAQKLEAVGQLTGGIAHDFNNMLQGVAGALDMARRRIDAGRLEDAGRYLDAALDAAGRAAGLTRRLLAFARRQQLEPREVDADGLVRSLAEMLRRTIGPAISLELDLCDGHGVVLCDANELESALLNLCINARDAMPGGGRLVIATRDRRLARTDLAGDAEPGDFVEVSVTDTGAGMPPGVRERVLEPFFTTKPLGQGTGLGLSQVYGFVRQSGGAMRIDSAAGQGTRVRLWLPLWARRPEAAGHAQGPASQEAQADGDATLLLVDDEAGVRIPTAERLRDIGYRVVEAPDGPGALRLLDEGLSPDLLLTDVGLPGGMDGVRLAEAIRQRHPDLPILFTTGYAAVALPEHAEVIPKPYPLDSLAMRVRSSLSATARKG